MRFKKYWFGLVVVIAIWACSNDDDNISLVPDRDRTEQQAADRDSLLTYLNTHYYNSGELTEGVDHSIDDIVIVEAALDENLEPIVPPGNTLLIDAVEIKETVYEEATYEYYILKINQGGGSMSPNFSDKVRVVYEGSLVTDASVFDRAPTPQEFDLVGVAQGIGTIVGWQRVMPEFNEAASFEIDGNGFVNYEDYGLGVMFLPSGLAYFSTQLIGIPSYSNLIFKFELYQTELNDHENDLVDSYLEDRNENLDPFDDDTDEDGIPDYLDADDDGDGVPTRNEDIDGDGDPTNDMSPFNPELPRYLDPEATDSNEDN
jgi:hypothetical protein